MNRSPFAPQLALLLMMTTAACGSSAGSGAAPGPAGSDDTEAGSGSDSGGVNGIGAGDASSLTDAMGSSETSGQPGDAGASGCPMLVVGSGPQSKWAHVDMPGHLAYETLPTGERLLDFSWAGYMGGGVAIPDAPVQQTVHPSGGVDDTAAIQAAIDAVAKLTPAVDGLRGAVLLSPGTFKLLGTLTLSTSGVVLRGSGSGGGGTVLQVGGSPRTAIVIAGTGSWEESTTSNAITDDYVPSGATSFHVASTTGLSVGAQVLVDRPITAGWIHFMGMDTLVRDGAAETWIAAGSVAHYDRTITGITGDLLTIDAPVPDTLDIANWGTGAPHATVATYTFAGRLEQVGVESMHLVAPEQTVPISDPTFQMLAMSAVQNGWVSDVTGQEFTSGFSVDGGSKWVTIQDSGVDRVAPIDGGAGYPFHFSVDGQGILVQRCSSSGIGVFSYATQDRANGPNVVLNMTSPEVDAGAHDNLQPHQRWATGLLVDGANTPSGGIDLMNRGYDGSGHGWAIGFGVVWNGVSSSMLIQQPPGSENWAIGSIGTQTTASAPGSTAGALPQGIVDSQGTAVAPQSLYLAQLCERLGPQALHAIGY
jgi:hypothetical protein